MRLFEGKTYQFSNDGKKWIYAVFVDSKKSRYRHFKVKAKTTTGFAYYKYFRPIEGFEKSREIVKNEAMVCKLEGRKLLSVPIEKSHYLTNEKIWFIISTISVLVGVFVGFAFNEYLNNL